MMGQKLEFATQYRHWDVVGWKMVMFRDKCHLLRFDSESYCCRQPLESNRFQEEDSEASSKCHNGDVQVEGKGWTGIPQQGRNDERVEVPAAV